MTRDEIIKALKDERLVPTKEGDALLDWLTDMAYAKEYFNPKVSKLFEKYWDPHDIINHISSRIRWYNTTKYSEPFDMLQEIQDLLRYKKFETYWSYFKDPEEQEFYDVDDEELRNLLDKLIEILEEANDE